MSEWSTIYRLKDPFDEGRDDYREGGVPFDANPYQPETDEFDDWAEGWLFECINLEKKLVVE